MTEWKDGDKVDPHNLIAIGNGDFGKGLDTAPSFPDGCRIDQSQNPAHETYDKDLGLVSTIGMYCTNKSSEEALISRVVYTVKPNAEGQNERRIIGEIKYDEPFDGYNCWTDDPPHASKNLRYLHTIAGHFPYSNLNLLEQTMLLPQKSKLFLLFLRKTIAGNAFWQSFCLLAILNRERTRI